MRLINAALIVVSLTGLAWADNSESAVGGFAQGLQNALQSRYQQYPQQYQQPGESYQQVQQELDRQEQLRLMQEQVDLMRQQVQQTSTDSQWWQK